MTDMMRKMKRRMMVYMSRRMIACDEASFLVSYQHDNRLGFRKWMQLKMHLLTCHICRRYVSQISQLNYAIERFRERCTSDTCYHHMPEATGNRIQQELNRGLNVK